MITKKEIIILIQSVFASYASEMYVYPCCCLLMVTISPDFFLIFRTELLLLLSFYFVVFLLFDTRHNNKQNKKEDERKKLTKPTKFQPALIGADHIYYKQSVFFRLTFRSLDITFFFHFLTTLNFSIQCTNETEKKTTVSHWTRFNISIIIKKFWCGVVSIHKFTPIFICSVLFCSVWYCVHVPSRPLDGGVYVYFSVLLLLFFSRWLNDEN